MSRNQSESNKLYLLSEEMAQAEAEQLEFPDWSEAGEIPSNPLGACNAAPERRAYRKTGEEMLAGNLDPVHWAASVKASLGDADRAKLLYANWRQESLTEELNELEDKKEALEMRRIQCFCPVVKVPRKQPSEYSKAGFWEGLSSLAWLGIVLALVRFIPQTNNILAAIISIIISVCFLVFVRKVNQLDRDFGGSTGYEKIMKVSSILLAIVSVFISMTASKFAPLLGF